MVEMEKISCSAGREKKTSPPQKTWLKKKKKVGSWAKKAAPRSEAIASKCPG